LSWRQKALQTARMRGIPTEEVFILLEHLGWTRLNQRLGQPPSTFDLATLESLWQQRVELRIPLAYLLGEVIWRDMSLRVTPSVLIPRSETEALIDIVAAWLTPGRLPGTWLDLGTGSGALAIGLARLHPAIRVYAVDISPEALVVAQSNRDRLAVSNQVQFLEGSWFDPIQTLGESIQGMIANPPYIPSELLSQLDPEVKDHEPWLALDGGVTGLTAIQHLIQSAPMYVQPGGFWAVEVMQGQAQEVASLLRHSGFYTAITIYQDLAGIERIVSGILAP
jgi:release factor glutamine methyltransferase